MIQIFKDQKHQITSKVIDSFDVMFLEAFNKAINAGQTEALFKIVSFVQRQISQAFQEERIEVIDQMIFLPSYFYITLKKNKDIRVMLARENTVYFKSLSYFLRPSYLTESETKKANKLLIDKFFHGVISYYHLILESGDENEIRQGLNEFNQMKPHGSDYYRIRTDLLYQIRDGGSEDKAQEERQKHLEFFYFQISHRRVGLILQSWLIYMFSIQKIDAERLNYILPKLKVQYQYFEDLIEDLIFIKNNEYRGYLGISNWDFKERESGIYTPPSPSHWILHGVVANLLMSNPHEFLGLIPNTYDFSYIYDEVKEILRYYKDDIGKWNKLFRIQAGQDENLEFVRRTFEQQERNVLNSFESLKVRFESSKEEKIAKQPLSESLIRDFKEQLFERWERACDSFKLFDAHRNIFFSHENTGLQKLGRTYFLERSKMMFIQDGHQHIYGSSDIGAYVGRENNDRFISKLLNKKENKHKVTDAIIGIDASLNRLIEKGFQPDQIIVPQEFSYKGGLSESQNFTPSWKAEGGETEPTSKIGYYKGIPVTTFNSSLLTNQIIVSEFSRAFKLDMLEDNDLLGNRLHISIRELSEQEVAEKFNENPDKWLFDEQGFKLDDQQAKQRVATSIYLEIWSFGRFGVTGSEAYEVLLLEGDFE